MDEHDSRIYPKEVIRDQYSLFEERERKQLTKQRKMKKEKNNKKGMSVNQKSRQDGVTFIQTSTLNVQCIQVDIALDKLKLRRY